ncbi:MAG: hypothetical protein ACLP56_15380, partial [Candidatus Sulfotelmatobacter sp.]
MLLILLLILPLILLVIPSLSQPRSGENGEEPAVRRRTSARVERTLLSVAFDVDSETDFPG